MKTVNIRSNPLRNVTIVTLLFFVFLSCTGKGAANGVTQGVVMFVSGKADVTHADGKAASLKQQDVLVKGDVVVTGSSSYLLIQIGDDILTRVQDNTTLEIRKLLEQAQTEVYLKNGQIITHVKKLTKDATFNIETPTAAAAVRGTSYSMSYYPSRSVIAVKEGKVELTMKDAKAKTKGRMVETANTVVISSDAPRTINEFESLEIDKMANIPFSEKDDIDSKKAFPEIEKICKSDDALMTAEIQSKGGPLPRSNEDLIKEKGFLSIVILYSNRTYTGEILSRGKEIRIRTFDGIVTVPFKQVRNIKRVQ